MRILCPVCCRRTMMPLAMLRELCCETDCGLVVAFCPGTTPPTPMLVTMYCRTVLSVTGDGGCICSQAALSLSTGLSRQGATSMYYCNELSVTRDSGCICSRATLFLSTGLRRQRATSMKLQEAHAPDKMHLVILEAPQQT